MFTRLWGYWRNGSRINTKKTPVVAQINTLKHDFTYSTNFVQTALVIRLHKSQTS